MPDLSTPVAAFGDFELDAARLELRRSGVRVALQRRPFELLRYLVRHRDRVVSKDELIDRVWEGVLVSEAALTSALRDVRRALGDDGRRQGIVRTHHGFGYRFVAPVVERASECAPSAPEAQASGVESDAFDDLSRRLVAFLARELERQREVGRAAA